jgi:hypothetical protein
MDAQLLERDIESQEIKAECRSYLLPIGCIGALLIVILFIALHFGGIL